MTVRLDNAVERHKRHAATFHLPPAGARRGLRPGDFAKVIFLVDPPVGNCDGERMWVLITKTSELGTYAGTLANDPTYAPMKHGDEVVFGPDHVIDIEYGLAVTRHARTLAGGEEREPEQAG